MRYAELVRKLHRLGYEFRRQGKGSHEVWWHPETKRYTVVPRHEGKEIPQGSLLTILKDLGTTREELDRV